MTKTFTFAPLETPYKYYPFPEPTLWALDFMERFEADPSCISLASFEHDQCLLNFLWLVCPEIDQYHDKPWKGNDVAFSIDEHRAKSIRDCFYLPPLEAVEKFIELDVNLVLTQDWPPGYHDVMRRRAAEADCRLKHGEGHNVVFIDFKKGKRSG